jgi:hypothetical protein
MHPTLHLSVRPRWEEIDAAREEAVAYLRQHDYGDAVVNAAGMIVCELAENATKYGAFAEPNQRIHIALTRRDGTLIIEVKSPVDAGDDENLRRLDRTVQWIRGFQNPFEAYLERLKEVSGQSLESRESGLGLVRIAYEGQSALDFFLDEHDVLAVSAVHRSQS